MCLFSQKPANGAGAASVDDDAEDGPSELYAEIDQPATGSGMIQSGNTRQSIAKEELYAEIDSPSLRPVQAGAASNRLRPFQHSDAGYEKVDFNGPKGEQIDSAGYAIVKEDGGAAGAGAASQLANDDEDYAECDLLPQAAASALPPFVINERLTRHGSDVSDYATVNNTDESTSAAASQPEPLAHASSGDSSSQTRPVREQKYSKKKEHLYQEIDEVRIEKSPPDKGS